VSVAYTTSLDGVTPEHLHGFFEGWSSSPTPERHLQILRGSYRVVLAREAGSPNVVGFVTAISDGVLAAFLPLLEVLPSHRGRGIGSELVRRMIDDLSHFYSVDLVCDHELGPFYERLGMQPLLGMGIRHPDRAAGG
jgi:ribosomal protein S18 acetylase RimI-like enzyme